MHFGRVLTEATPLLLKGLLVTVEVSALSLAIAVLLGLITCLMGLSHNKVLKAIAKFYIWIMRGTPVMVQAFYVYFAIPQLLQMIFHAPFRMTAFVAGAITLSLNAGAYMAEIFRGGVEAVDKGQMEAARSLGLTKGRAMIKIILPQAFRICIPSLVNQFIITIKDTSIVSSISMAEIVYQARIYMGNTMESFATWTLVAIMYLVIISILSAVSRSMERKLKNGQKSQSK